MILFPLKKFKFFERKVIFLSNFNVTLLLTDINPNILGWDFIEHKRKLV